MRARSHLAAGVGVLLIVSAAAAQPPGGFPGGPAQPPQPAKSCPRPSRTNSR